MGPTRNPKRQDAWLHGVITCARDFCVTTSMHGFIHIAASNRSWVERVLWACATVVAILGAVCISMGQWQRYNENPTVVALEKDFRSWDYCMPGITVCDQDRVDAEKLPSVIKKYWGIDAHDEEYDHYTRFVNTVAQSDLFRLQGFQDFEGEDLEVDLYQLAVDVMPEFKIKKVTWSLPGSDVRWFPVMTEAGACYTTNSLALVNDAIEQLDNSTALFPLTCKYASLSCYVNLEGQYPTSFYIHSPYDIADVTSQPYTGWKGMERTVEFSVSETGCGHGVRELRPQRRRCLYTDEPPEGREVYSTNSCHRSCRNKQALQLCGCKPFYNFHEEGRPCSLTGMRCLAAHAASLAARNAACACPAMCVDALFMPLSNTTAFWDIGDFAKQSRVKFRVQAPRTRYKREIIFHFQDLVVSFGGAAGLFLGASFISFVEILYFVMERILGALDIRQHDVPIQVVQVKKSKIPYEQARIRELTTILEEEGVPPETARVLPLRQLY